MSVRRAGSTSYIRRTSISRFIIIVVIVTVCIHKLIFLYLPIVRSMLQFGFLMWCGRAITESIGVGSWLMSMVFS